MISDEAFELNCGLRGEFGDSSPECAPDVTIEDAGVNL
jgi:hypothetical protein